MRTYPIAFGLACALVPGVASAGDFTGVYAGVHAGYAFGHEHGRGVASVAPGNGGSEESDRGLPPSAAAASRAMDAARTGAVRPSRASPQR